MATDGSPEPQEVLPPGILDVLPDVGVSALRIPLDTLAGPHVVDVPWSVPIPVLPLVPVQLTQVPEVGRLLLLVRAGLRLLAHPYPWRVPAAPLSREERIALYQNDRARQERELRAYRSFALGGGRR